MAKNNKRQKASAKDTQNNSKLAAELAERLTAKAPSSTSRATEFNPDYTHVKRDLSRIGVLAGSFFAILIALSFFIK
jgi:uncharacterized membrane protein